MSGGHCGPHQSVSAGWHGAAGLSGLGENNQRHTRTEKAPGEKQAPHAHTTQLLSNMRGMSSDWKHPHSKG